jgi:hypothetical protein
MQLTRIPWEFIGNSSKESYNPDRINERSKVKRKPDLLLIIMALFGLGVVATLAIPMTSNESVAAPASELQAGVIVE